MPAITLVLRFRPNQSIGWNLSPKQYLCLVIPLSCIKYPTLCVAYPSKEACSCWCLCNTLVRKSSINSDANLYRIGQLTQVLRQLRFTLKRPQCEWERFSQWEFTLCKVNSKAPTHLMTLLLYLQPLIPPTDAPHYLLICKLPKDFSSRLVHGLFINN